VGSTEDAEPAAEGEAGEADLRAGPGRDCQAVGVEVAGELAEANAAASPHAVGGYRHVVERGDVDEGPGCGGVTGEAVTTAADGAGEAVTGDEPNRLGNVVGRRAAHDGVGFQVVESGVERTGASRVFRRAAQVDLTIDRRGQRRPPRTGHVNGARQRTASDGSEVASRGRGGGSRHRTSGVLLVEEG
jgi:hypothetical protein